MFGFVHRIVAFARPAMADTGVWPHKTVLVFVIAGLGWTLTTSALASSDGSPTPDVPPGSLCTIEAPSLHELNAAILTPPAGASPVPMRTPGTVPEGVPADAKTMAAITAVVQELVGCYNAGELLRAYGLYTDDYLYRLFNRQGGFTRASYDSYATPEPESNPSRHTAILSISDVRLLEDGTAGATVTLRYASIPVRKTFFFTFVREGDYWLIDGILGEISFSVS
jgi:hypothetical protein